MKLNSKYTPYLKYVALTLVVVLSPLLLFQNCSQFAEPADSDGSSSSRVQSVAAPDPNHVPDDEVAPPSKQIRIGNRRYMAEVFISVFTAADGTTAPGLTPYVFKWVERRGAQMGGGCDTVDSMTLFDCNDDPSGSNLAAHSDSNAIRESFKIQVCEEMLGTPVGLKIALENAGLNVAALPEPTFDNLKPVYELFYRTDEAPSYFLQVLSQLNTDMKAKGETPENIWRGILLVTCESPEWQLL